MMNYMKILFFVLFYVVLGTAGITLPWMVNKNIVVSEVAIGLVTIVVSTVGYNAAEKVLQLFDDEGKTKSKKQTAFINISALFLALIFTMVVCNCIDSKYAIIISIIAYLLSCLFWWFQNWNNKNLENTSAPDTLGGSIEQFNKPQL